VGAGAGLDLSIDAFVGFALDPDSGPTDTFSYDLGPFATDIEIHPTTGRVVGGSFGLGWGIPVGAAVGVADGGDLTARELSDWLAAVLGDLSDRYD